jgi:hypothetical protein
LTAALDDRVREAEPRATALISDDARSLRPTANNRRVFDHDHGDVVDDHALNQHGSDHKGVVEDGSA